MLANLRANVKASAVLIAALQQNQWLMHKWSPEHIVEPSTIPKIVYYAWYVVEIVLLD